MTSLKRGRRKMAVSSFMVIVLMCLIGVEAQLNIIGHMFPRRNPHLRNRRPTPVPMPLPSRGMSVPNGIWSVDKPAQNSESEWSENSGSGPSIGHSTWDDPQDNPDYFDSQTNTQDEYSGQDLSSNYHQPPLRSRERNKRPFAQSQKSRMTRPQKFGSTHTRTHGGKNHLSPPLETNWDFDSPKKPLVDEHDWDDDTDFYEKPRSGNRGSPSNSYRKPFKSNNKFKPYDDYDQDRPLYKPRGHQGPDFFDSDDFVSQNSYSTIGRNRQKFTEDSMAPPPVESNNFYNAPSLTLDSTSDYYDPSSGSIGSNYNSGRPQSPKRPVHGRLSAFKKQKNKHGGHISGPILGNKDDNDNFDFSSLPFNPRNKGQNKQARPNTLSQDIDSELNHLLKLEQSAYEAKNPHTAPSGSSSTSGSVDDLMDEVKNFQGTGQMDPAIQHDPATEPIVHINLGRLVDDLSTLCSSLLPSYVDFGQRFCNTKPKLQHKNDEHWIDETSSN